MFSARSRWRPFVLLLALLVGACHSGSERVATPEFYEARHRARLTARAMMSDAAEVEALRARDLEKYGDPDGPTFESLVAKGRAEGKSDEAIYAGIIDSSQRTNKAANARSGI